MVSGLVLHHFYTFLKNCVSHKKMTSCFRPVLAPFSAFFSRTVSRMKNDFASRTSSDTIFDTFLKDCVSHEKFDS